MFTKTLRVCFTVGYNIKPSVLYFLARKLSCCFGFVISYISSDCFLFFKLPAYNSLFFNTHATRTHCLCRRGNTHTHTQRERERNQHRNIAYSARFLNSNRRPNRLKTPEQFKLIIPHRRTIRSILIVGMLHLLIRFRLSHSSFPAPHTASPLLHRHANPRTGISFVETRAVYIQARKWINHSIARCSTGQTQGSGWRSRHNVMQISYQKV